MINDVKSVTIKAGELSLIFEFIPTRAANILRQGSMLQLSGTPLSK